MIHQLPNGHFITIDENGSSVDEEDVKEIHSGQAFQEADSDGNRYVILDEECIEVEFIQPNDKIDIWN